MIASPTIAPGQCVIVRIVAHIARTGASFLVNHAGHALRVHEQQIRLVESEVLS